MVLANETCIHCLLDSPPPSYASRPMKLLLAEDDCELGRLLAADLEDAGHSVEIAREGIQALKLASESRWDVIIMDVSMPGMSGFEVVRALREKQIETPIIFLTARANVAHRVEGLSIGGDDYLTKPFAVDELKARLAVLHKRHLQTRKPISTLPPGWHMNPLQRRVTIKGRAVDLQPREWSLLEIMMANEWEVLTKTHLLAEVWGLRFDPGTNVVDAVICRLRRKLDVSPTASHIETIRGRGYIFRSHA